MYKGRCVGGPHDGEVLERDEPELVMYLMNEKLEPVDSGVYRFSEKTETWTWDGPPPITKH